MLPWYIRDKIPLIFGNAIFFRGQFKHWPIWDAPFLGLRSTSVFPAQHRTRYSLGTHSLCIEFLWWVLSLQGFFLALTDQQGTLQFGAPGSPCSQHSSVRGGYKKDLILSFHITMPWDLYSISTQISQNIFSCWQWEKKQNSEQNAFQSPGLSLTPQTQGALFRTRVLPSYPPGNLPCPCLTYCLTNTATMLGY